VLSGLEIQANLTKFVARWAGYAGSERAEAQTVLKEHRALDIAVVEAYGWPASIAQNGPELVRRLTELNQEIVEGGRPYNPFGHTDA
jgi:hypothetical protein